jgi:hypothetical protein
MQPIGRPQVVGGEQQKKQVCRVPVSKRVMKKDWYVPAEERRTGYPRSGDDDQPLVRCGVFTQRKREPDEDRELESRLEGRPLCRPAKIPPRQACGASLFAWRKPALFASRAEASML